LILDSLVLKDLLMMLLLLMLMAGLIGYVPMVHWAAMQWESIA
jgi:hypothetical protein